MATLHAAAAAGSSAVDRPLTPAGLTCVPARPRLHTAPRPPQDGDRFWRMPEAYIRGNTIKYLRVPDEVLDKAKEAEAQMKRDGALLLAGCRA